MDRHFLSAALVSSYPPSRAESPHVPVCLVSLRKSAVCVNLRATVIITCGLTGVRARTGPTQPYDAPTKTAGLQTVCAMLNAG